MKKKLISIIFLLTALTTYSQVDFMTGMGISFQSTPSLKDYINNIAPSGEGMADYSSAVTFFFETDYSINPTFDIGIEYEVKIYSFNTSFGGLGKYDLSYLAHSPSVIGYYVLQGEGYKFKFGGGAGYRIISVDEELPTSNTVTNFTANGFGLLLKTQAHTLLSGNFYAYFGADIRYDIIGEATNENSKLEAPGLKEEVNFNTLSFGVKIGVSYLIR